MKASLKVALFLGVAPLVTGMVIFAAWVLSRAEWLMAAGVITIYVGMCAVAVGAVCLAVYLWQSWRSKAIARRRLVCQAIAVLGLFLANFLAAGGAAFAAIVIDTRYTVSVTNQTNVPLESARIEGGGVDIPLGIIAPGATVKRSFRIEHDGKLVLKGAQGTKILEATIDGYVTNSLGGDKIVIIESNGTVNTKDRRPTNLD